jgi:hypothetical protein
VLLVQQAQRVLQAQLEQQALLVQPQQLQDQQVQQVLLVQQAHKVLKV